MFLHCIAYPNKLTITKGILTMCLQQQYNEGHQYDIIIQLFCDTAFVDHSL